MPGCGIFWILQTKPLSEFFCKKIPKNLSDFLIFDLGATTFFIANSFLSPPVSCENTRSSRLPTSKLRFPYIFSSISVFEKHARLTWVYACVSLYAVFLFPFVFSFYTFFYFVFENPKRLTWVCACVSLYAVGSARSSIK